MVNRHNDHIYTGQNHLADHAGWFVEVEPPLLFTKGVKSCNIQRPQLKISTSGDKLITGLRFI